MSSVPKVTYFKSDGVIDEGLLDKVAEKQAQDLQDVSATQLRRFYDHVLTFRRMLEDQKEQAGDADEEQAFLRIRPEFKMLRAKAFYTYGRAKGREKDRLQPLFEFLQKHTASVETAKQFRAFCKHFEAVVAFHKYFDEEKKRKESR